MLPQQHPPEVLRIDFPLQLQRRSKRPDPASVRFALACVVVLRRRRHLADVVLRCSRRQLPDVQHAQEGASGPPSATLQRSS